MSFLFNLGERKNVERFVKSSVLGIDGLRFILKKKCFKLFLSDTFMYNYRVMCMDVHIQEDFTC